MATFLVKDADLLVTFDVHRREIPRGGLFIQKQNQAASRFVG
jgi:hypothetical protein